MPVPARTPTVPTKKDYFLDLTFFLKFKKYVMELHSTYGRRCASMPMFFVDLKHIGILYSKFYYGTVAVVLKKS